MADVVSSCIPNSKLQSYFIKLSLLNASPKTFFLTVHIPSEVPFEIMSTLLELE